MNKTPTESPLAQGQGVWLAGMAGHGGTPMQSVNKTPMESPMAQGRGVWLAGMAGHGCAPNSTQKQVRREQALREQTAAVVNKHAKGVGR